MGLIAEPAARLCLSCDAPELVAPEEAVWPPGWECPTCGHRIADRDGLSILAPALADTQTGFDLSLFSYLDRVESSHFWFVVRKELIVGLARRYFPRSDALLEVGCGNGAVLQALAQTRKWDRLVGSDLHPTGLAIARTRLNHGIELVQMDAERIPARRAFDLIGAFDVLEHLVDDEAAIRQLVLALRPDGGVIVTVPQHPGLWGREDEVAHHQRRYRRGELEEKLIRNGFDVVFSSSFVSLLVPLMALSRRASRRQRNCEVAREFEIGWLGNSILRAILRTEVRLTLRGVRWPVGGSRVTVAKLPPLGAKSS